MKLYETLRLRKNVSELHGTAPFASWLYFDTTRASKYNQGFSKPVAFISRIDSNVVRDLGP